MALALQPRFAPLLRPTAPVRAFTTSLRLARDDFPPTPRVPPSGLPSRRQSDGPLPHLPGQKEVDPLAKAVRPARAPHPYDANKTSIADLIGKDMGRAFSSPDFGLHQPRVPVRSVPSTGRTVHVAGSLTAARAFAFVNQRCTMNQIPMIAQRQRFHERPGLKRKRLRRQRWRGRFKNGFHHTVTRVQELARQGW